MDMSGCASPNLVDINGDSLKEILVGLIDGDVAYFENNGTQAEPSFTFIDSSYFDFNIAFQPTMSFGDFDADGDLDLAVTTNGFVGSVCIYENIGTVNNPEYELWMTIITSPDFSFTGIELCDIDADGDLDLFFGDNYDRIRYYENVGTPDNPRFQFRSLNYLNQPYSGDGYILALQIWTMMTIMT
jgi:hypothetical protein